jgi:arginase family enzyme
MRASKRSGRCFRPFRGNVSLLAQALHLDLDKAWPADALPVETLDATSWGPPLRFSAPSRLIEEFYREIGGKLPRFLVYGSGDFHHLTALWLRRMAEPFVLVSFDNHPDWDVRPPRWCCGGWANRALELPHVKKVSVWGCGNFECWWPGRLFGNRRAEREGRLEIHPWADGRPLSDQTRRGAILRANWRECFAQFVQALEGSNVYVTIDLDCLRGEEAVTNWESGRFTVEDVAWALTQLRASTPVVGGDICGAFSPPVYARLKQRFAAEMDHPKLPARDLEAAAKINLRTFDALWPLLSE